MYRIYYAERDTTLYERYPDQNTGIDQILELTKTASGSKLLGIVQGKTYNTRFLIDFGTQITDLATDISKGNIPTLSNATSTSASAFLNIRAADASDILHSYDIKAYPISESWTNGNGNYSDNPIQKYGASWNYRDSEDLATSWNTGSAHSANTSAGTSISAGGGTWITGSGFEASQSFSNESPDIRINVTDIVNQWVNGTITNNGFIIKFPYNDEISTEVLGSLKFFGRETHTIYVPRLEITWNDQSRDGNLTSISTDTYVPYIKNIKSEYKRSEIARFRVGVRPEFPNKSYATESFYLTSDRLPESSQYQIFDSITDEIIIKGTDVITDSTTLISHDNDGSYFDLRMDSFMPERFYRIELTISRGYDKQTFDDFYFKVVK
jgi:hypothetical protein